jgi:hypothetical protein
MAILSQKPKKNKRNSTLLTELRYLACALRYLSLNNCIFWQWRAILLPPTVKLPKTGEKHFLRHCWLERSFPFNKAPNKGGQKFG